MLGISSELPFYYSMLCALLGVCYASFLYFKNRRINSKILVWFFFCFRATFITILSFLLLNPVFKSTSYSTEKPVLIIAKDASQSIKENINDAFVFLDKKLPKFEKVFYSFSDKLYNEINQENNGLETNYSTFFSEIHNRFENRNVAGIIFASDGCYNVGTNPEYLSYDFPVYSIALGDTVSYEDVRIDNVLKNDIAFFGNTFPLEISLGSIIKNDKLSRLSIWHNLNKVYEQSIIFKKNIDYQTHTVYLPANKIGLQKYTIKVDTLNREKNIINNVLSSYIDIVESRYNILILKERNSPDLSAYRSVLEKNENYNVELKDINEDFLIEKYQLIVMFGVDKIPDSVLTTNIPLIIFNANQKHYSSLNSPILFSQKGGVEDVYCYKSHSFSKFLFSPKLINLISESPPLVSLFGIYDVQGDIRSVLSQKKGSIESNNPIVMLQELNSRKIVFIAAEGWWKWKLYDYSKNYNNDAFDELFAKLTQYMILKEDKSLFRVNYDKQYKENDEVVLRALLYNESYELVKDKEIGLKVTDERGQEYDFQFSKEGDFFLARLGVMQSGTYTFSAHVSGSDLYKKGAFDVKDVQLEQLGRSADHQVLRKIAKLSGGRVFDLSSINRLVKLIEASDKNSNRIHQKAQLKELINIPWVLFLLLFIIFFEWLVRRYNQLI